MQDWNVRTAVQPPALIYGCPATDFDRVNKSQGWCAPPKPRPLAGAGVPSLRGAPSLASAELSAAIGRRRSLRQQIRTLLYYSVFVLGTKQVAKT